MQQSLNMCQNMYQNHIGRSLDKHFELVFSVVQGVSVGCTRYRWKWPKSVIYVLKVLNKRVEVYQLEIVLGTCYQSFIVSHSPTYAMHLSL